MIGKSSTQPRLEQILEQLEIPYKDYIWWNSINKIKITIPPELYTQNSGTTRGSIRVDKESMAKHRGQSIKINQKACLLTHADPKIMITKDQLIMFYVEHVFKKKELKKNKEEQNSSDDEWDFEEVEKQHLVCVKDVQRYNWADFEFIQKLPDIKKAF